MDWAKKEGFFNAKVPRERMTVPEIGDIYVYGLTVGEKDDYESSAFQLTGRNRKLKLANARAQLLILTVRDQHGNRLFGDKDMGRLCQLPAVISEPILDTARRLSGMATGDIEELVKNSETAPEQTESESNTD